VVFTSERIVVDTIVPSMLQDQERGMDMKADGTYKIGYIGWELFSVGASPPPAPETSYHRRAGTHTILQNNRDHELVHRFLPFFFIYMKSESDAILHDLAMPAFLQLLHSNSCGPAGLLTY